MYRPITSVHRHLRSLARRYLHWSSARYRVPLVSQPPIEHHTKVIFFFLSRFFPFLFANIIHHSVSGDHHGVDHNCSPGDMNRSVPVSYLRGKLYFNTLAGTYQSPLFFLPSFLVPIYHYYYYYL